VSPPKTAEPIEMPLGLWTRVGPGNHWRAHWRNLANMFEPSMCRGDVTFLSITLTTCFKSLSSLILFHAVWCCAYYTAGASGERLGTSAPVRGILLQLSGLSKLPHNVGRSRDSSHVVVIGLHQ